MLNIIDDVYITNMVVGGVNTNFSSSTNLQLGMPSTSDERTTSSILVRLGNIEQLMSVSKINKATINLYAISGRAGSTTSDKVNISVIKANWNVNTVTWANAPTVEAVTTDTIVLNKNGLNIFWEIDITNVINYIKDNPIYDSFQISWSSGSNYSRSGYVFYSSRVENSEFSPYLSVDVEYNTKYLIKSQNKIHSLSFENNCLIYPNIQEPLIQEEYEKWGMDNFNGYNSQINKIRLQMEDGIILETGKIFKCIINKNEINANINNLYVISNELSLIKTSDGIFTFNEFGEWENIGLEELLNQIDFDEYGINSLNEIPSDKWNELGNEFEVLIFTTDTETDKFIEITTNSFVPIKKTSESDFEILMWVQNKLDNSPKLEITVPPFRPLDKLDNQFNIIMGEYKPSEDDNV